jgi:hypothetical protein
MKCPPLLVLLLCVAVLAYKDNYCFPQTRSTLPALPTCPAGSNRHFSRCLAPCPDSFQQFLGFWCRNGAKLSWRPTVRAECPLDTSASFGLCHSAPCNGRVTGGVCIPACSAPQLVECRFGGCAVRIVTLSHCHGQLAHCHCQFYLKFHTVTLSLTSTFLSCPSVTLSLSTVPQLSCRVRAKSLVRVRRTRITLTLTLTTILNIIMN